MYTIAFAQEQGPRPLVLQFLVLSYGTDVMGSGIVWVLLHRAGGGASAAAARPEAAEPAVPAEDSAAASPADAEASPVGLPFVHDIPLLSGAACCAIETSTAPPGWGLIVPPKCCTGRH